MLGQNTVHHFARHRDMYGLSGYIGRLGQIAELSHERCAFSTHDFIARSGQRTRIEDFRRRFNSQKDTSEGVVRQNLQGALTRNR